MPVYKIHLEDPEGEVTVEGVTYHDGDEFILPKGWSYDKEFSKFAKKIAFSYPTERRSRNVQTGAWTKEIDMKRVLLPVVEDEPDLAVVADDE